MIRLNPIRIAALYVIGGALWIVLTDLLFSTLLADFESFVVVQVAKGLGFIMVTGAVLFGLLRRREASLDAVVGRLETSEERYQHLFEHSPMPTWEEDFTGVVERLTTLRRQGVEDLESHLEEHPDLIRDLIDEVRVVGTNQAADELLEGAGSDRADAIPVLAGEEDNHSYIEELVAVWEGRNRLDTEIRNNRDGQEYAYLVRWTAPLVKRGPDYSRVVVTVTDVSELRQAEHHLEELLRAKDEFVASVSHELRTPLTGVLGFAELLAEQSEELGPEERADLLGLLVRQSNEVAGLVEDLLVAARAETGQLTFSPRSVDLRAEAEGVLAGMGEGERDADLTVADGTAIAWADPTRVRQIFRNLIQNAYRYGGPRIRVAVSRRDGQAILSVADDGPGIPDEDREHVFDPYYRTGQSQGRPSSVGLGLTVSRRLARLMGGDLTYRREEGISVFEVALPLAEEEPAARGPDAGDVRRVLEEGPPAMVFQPIYDLRRLGEGLQAAVGFEALARFPSDVGPAAWFAAASDAGLRLDLELAAIAAALEARAELPADAYLALNLSMETLTSPRLMRLTEEMGVSPSTMVLEVTQRDALEHYDQVRDAVYGMAALGFRIALDDVGVDEVHLRQLHKLRPDIVKLDIRVVRRVDADSEERGLAQAVTALAEVLGAEVVAEGIERDEEVEALRSLGVHFGQGYHLGRPAPPGSFSP